LWLSLKALLAIEKLVNFCLMSGYDVKLSGQAPYLPWAKIKGTYYYFYREFAIAFSIHGVVVFLTEFKTYRRGKLNIHKHNIL
jgi:hypothetical protein